MTAGILHLATYFDRHYLTRGLALYRSLARHSPPFVLWVLCLDDETHRTLARLRLDYLNLVRLSELEGADPALLGVKDGRQPVEYYWTCGPAFLLYVLGQDPGIDTITYLDADLFFFSDPTPIYNELGSGSIFLVHHRWSPEELRFRSVVRPVALPKAKGTYNTGLLVFRRTSAGLACLRQWREQCLEWCFDRVERDRFGDQRYLDRWPGRFEGVIISRHNGVGLAPWNVAGYRVAYELGNVLVDDAPLVFYHFNRLRAITRWLYKPTRWRYGRGMEPVVKRHIYVPYVRELRAADGRIRAADGPAGNTGSLRKGEHKVRLLAAMVRQRNFLIVTDSFAL